MEKSGYNRGTTGANRGDLEKTEQINRGGAVFCSVFGGAFLLPLNYRACVQVG